MTEHDEELRDEIKRLTAGADQSPVPGGMMMTPGQVLHRLNTASKDERLRMAERILGAFSEAHDCLLFAHRVRIEELEGRAAVAQARLDKIEDAVIGFYGHPDKYKNWPTAVIDQLEELHAAWLWRPTIGEPS